jgi:hypothetical protein
MTMDVKWQRKVPLYLNFGFATSRYHNEKEGEGVKGEEKRGKGERGKGKGVFNLGLQGQGERVKGVESFKIIRLILKYFFLFPLPFNLEPSPFPLSPLTFSQE